MNTPLKFWIHVILFVLISWSGALAVRRAVYHQQTRSLKGQEAPFLMESALQYRMTRMVAETGTLPEVDLKVQVPEGVVMRETYSVGAEWVYAGLASLLPDEWTHISRVRWISAALFCLAIPFAGLWARQNSGSMGAAWITSGILAASPAFAVRSSGLELSRENLAIPLFTLFLWMQACARSSETSKARFVFSLLAAGSLALGQCVWDLTQMVTGLWAVWEWIRMFRRPDEREPVLPGCVAVALLLASVLNPYLRSHGSVFSPVMAMVLSLFVLSLPVPSFRNRKLQAGLLVGFLGFFTLLGRLFTENYSHFGELLFAKLRYLNVKPMDPGDLNYLQRIMWTPALNSTTWELTKSYFLFTLITFSITLFLLILGKQRAGYRFGLAIFAALITLPVTILFFRFHVFWVLFAAVGIGTGLLALLSNFPGSKRYLIAGGLFLFLTGGECYLLLFFEPSTSLAVPEEKAEFFQLVKAMGGDVTQSRGNRWGRPGAAYGALQTLSEQLQAIPDPGPVLANFGISGSILEQTGLPIVLHPKFETPGIRERVREFYHHLFLGTEDSLREWAVSYGARYYVHSNGNLSDLDIRNAPRYMVDALDPPDHAPVYVLENRPQEATWFRPVGGNARYRIFRIVLPEDEEFASTLTQLARRALESGDVETAERRARQALSYHWKYEPAQELLALLLSL